MKKIFITLLVVLAVFLTVWYVINSNQNETDTSVSILSTEVRDITQDSKNSGIYVTFSNGEKKLIAESDPILDPIDPERSDTYKKATISPDSTFVAVEGTGFEEGFVQVYDARTDALSEKIWGKVIAWTDDGLLKIQSCNLAQENCVEKISKNSNTPWLVTEVSSSQSNVTKIDEDTYRSNFSSTTDLISNINSADNLSQFAEILNEVGPDAIKGTGPFTLFIPTNAALESVGETLSKEELIDLVRLHTVATEYKYDDLTDGVTLSTVGLDTLTVKREAGSVKLNNSAYIIEADIISSNGVFHVIDNTL